MKKFRFLWVILFTLFACFSFFACDPKGINPPDPDPKPVITDSVLIQIIIDAPTCAIFSGVELKFWHSALPNGYFDEYYSGDIRSFKCVYKDAIAKAMIGTKCRFNAAIQGKNCSGAPGSFKLTNASSDPNDNNDFVTTLQKGLNTITLKYSVNN